MEKYPNSRLDIKELKKFGYSFSIGMFILTTVGILKSFSLAIIIITSTLSIFHFIGALLYPNVLSFTNKIITVIGHCIGVCLTNVCFTVFYYILFTPFALVLRISGKDVIGNPLYKKGWIDIKDSDNNKDRIEKQY